MNDFFLQGYRAAYGFRFPMGGSGVLILVLIWSFFWKGLGLWHSAQRKQGRWFVLLLLVNTLGILEIIYLFLVAKIPTSELFEAKKK